MYELVADDLSKVIGNGAASMLSRASKREQLFPAPPNRRRDVHGFPVLSDGPAFNVDTLMA